MPTIEVSQLQVWANDPEQAIVNIKTLLNSIGSEDQSTVDWATEALENCGEPRSEDAAWIASQLSSDTADVAYWAATLLGRLGEGISGFQKTLVAVAIDSKRTANVRQRAIWALGRIPNLNNETVTALQSLQQNTSLGPIASMAELVLQGASKNS
jgi:HEAT repeat protein